MKRILKLLSSAVVMKDGTYKTTVPSYTEIHGLATTGSMTITVEVKDNRFSNIEEAERFQIPFSASYSCSDG